MKWVRELFQLIFSFGSSDWEEWFAISRHLDPEPPKLMGVFTFIPNDSGSDPQGGAEGHTFLSPHISPNSGNLHLRIAIKKKGISKELNDMADAKVLKGLHVCLATLFMKSAKILFLKSHWELNSKLLTRGL